MTGIFILFCLLYIGINCQSSRGNSSSLSFCPFFNNRAPQPQATLTNCTWFRENSCCLQHEIDVSFSRVKPLIGATGDCQKYTNYLMCYICAPDQNEFYKKERLTVCESFCDLLYDACKLAILKGNQIKQLYEGGRNFCLSRRFLVGNSNNCFSVPNVPSHATNGGNASQKLQSVVILFLIFISCGLCFGTLKLQLTKMSERSYFGWSLSSLKVLISILLLSSGQHCAGQIIQIEDIDSLGRSVSSFISDYSHGVLSHPNFENQLKSFGTNKIVDESILNVIKAELNTFFKKRKDSVKSMAKALSVANEEFVQNVSEKFSGDESMAVFGFLKQTSLYRSSAYKIPESSTEDNRFNDILRSEILNKLTHEDDSYKRTFFAPSNGGFHIYPNQEWKPFEPRVQPWYLGVKEAPSNVVLILDASDTSDHHKFERSKETALLLLTSFAQHQRVAVISSSSPAWTTSGNEQNISATMLGCVKDRLVRATYGNVKMLMESVKNVKSFGGSDHSKAFHMAFDLLRKQQTSHSKHLECRSIILFVTDGDQDELLLRCSPGSYHYTEGNTRVYQQGEICQHDTDWLLASIQRQQRGLPGAKANIFTFLTSQTRKLDSVFPGKLACQNNGALSRVYKDAGLFKQMSPFFDYIRGREYSYEPIVTGPYESPVDKSLVITFSAPVVTQKSSRILGVVGIEVMFSALESILEVHHDYLYMMNLLDGSAVIHPLIQKSYEHEGEWIDVPLMDLEMEDSTHSAEFPQVIREMIERSTRGVVVKTRASEGFEIEEGGTLWIPVKSILYLFAHIEGTHFGFGIKAISLKDEGNKYFMRTSEPHKNAELQTNKKNFLHTLFEGNSSFGLKLDQQHILYPGVAVSFEHSSVILTPPAFCQSSQSRFKTSHFQDQINKLINGDKSINVKNENDDDDDKNEDDHDDKNEDDHDDDKDKDEEFDDKDEDVDRCIITERARQDIFLTSLLEESWKEVRMVSDSLKSLYVATIDGVVRHFPGLQVPESMIHHPLRYQWFIRSVLNPGKIVLTKNRASFSGMPNIVTMSRLVDSTHKVVLSADTSKEELKQKILHAIDTKLCCLPPPSPPDSSCVARCYLLSDQGEIVMSLSDGLDKSRSANIHQQFPFVYKSLVKHKLLHPMKTTELKRRCPPAVGHETEEKHEPMRACMVVKLEPHIKKSILDKMGGTFGRSSDGITEGEICHKGIFYLTSINNTNLFLLTLVNYTNKQCSDEIKQLKQHFVHRTQPLCATHPNYFASRTNATTCPKKRYVSLYCQYASSSAGRAGTNFALLPAAMFLAGQLVTNLCIYRY